MNVQSIHIKCLPNVEIGKMYKKLTTTNTGSTSKQVIQATMTQYQKNNTSTTVETQDDKFITPKKTVARNTIETTVSKKDEKDSNPFILLDTESADDENEDISEDKDISFSSNSPASINSDKTKSSSTTDVAITHDEYNEIVKMVQQGNSDKIPVEKLSAWIESKVFKIVNTALTKQMTRNFSEKVQQDTKLKMSKYLQSQFVGLKQDIENTATTSQIKVMEIVN